MIKTTVLVCAVLLLASFAKADDPDTCVFTSGQYTTWDQARQCFYSILLDPSVKAQTIDALKKSLELYAFLDIANNAPDPNLPIRVNMLKELDTINAWPYKYDYEFHDAIRALYLQLNDAHTQYYMPSCYQTLTAMIPISPLSYVDSNGDQKVFVSPFVVGPLFQYYQDTYGIDPTEFLGAEILQVNGLDAVDYFEGYANNSLGMCKDIGTRYNYAMTIVKPVPSTLSVALGYWQQRTKRNPFPRQPFATVSMTLTNGTSVEMDLPWAVLASTTYDGTESFKKDYAAPYTNCVTKDRSVRPTEAGDEYRTDFSHASSHVEVHEAVYEDILRKAKAESNIPNVDEALFTPLVNSTNLSFWKLNDDNTMVMYLDTMAPSSLPETFRALNQGFEAAAENNLNRLIIDLTDNGGGSICFGRSLLAYLQKEESNPQNWGPQDLPCSPLQLNLTQSAVKKNVTNTVWSPGFYDNQQNEPVDNMDTSYLIPGVPHIRGGLLRNYSRLVHIDGCGDFGYKIQPAKEYSPEDILIITHGFCGSTCAYFANHLRLYDNVRVIVIGGLAHREQMQYTSFPGLQVLDDPALYQQLYRLGQTVDVGSAAPGELSPRCLPTTAAYRMCIREIYPPTKQYNATPMEYAFQPADWHLNATLLTTIAPQFTWYEALQYF